jgi:hypothetical protein
MPGIEQRQDILRYRTALPARPQPETALDLIKSPLKRATPGWLLGTAAKVAVIQASKSARLPRQVAGQVQGPAAAP